MGYLQLSIVGNDIVIMTQKLEDLKQLMAILKKFGVEVELEGVSRCG